MHVGRGSFQDSKGSGHVSVVLDGSYVTGSLHLPSKSPVYKETPTVLSHEYTAQVFSMPHHHLKAMSLGKPLGMGKASRAHIPRTAEGGSRLCAPRSGSWGNPQLYSPMASHCTAVPYFVWASADGHLGVSTLWLL